jgi:phenylalanyl-tRNA synthetase alpha chain
VPGASEDASDGAVPLTLSGPERSVLVVLRSAEALPLEEEEVARRAGIAIDPVRGSLQRLRAKQLVTVDEEHESTLLLTSRGEATLQKGLPERRLLSAIARRGGSLAPADAAAEGLDGEERSAAIGILRRRGYLEDGVPLRVRAEAGASESLLPEEVVMKQVANGEEDLDEAIVSALERRGLVRTDRRSIKRWGLSDEGRSMVVAPEGEEQIGALTRELITTGSWRGRGFRPYDVRAAVPYLTGARPNPYLAWLEEFEEILIGLGFDQAEGPLVETEFWNNDALFMPQDHPARSIHDALSLEGIRGRPPSAELLAAVAAVQEGRPLPGEDRPLGPGWGVPYDPAIGARPVLRSQTTAVSARFLAAHPRPPFRMYSIDRNFRREEVDARHTIEFAQCEGVLGDEGITIRHLVGMFHALAEAIGIRELKIRPSYFPFTEPSIEGYVRHPRLGWIEVFPGGMMRPEVLRPLGVEVPVAAWGIGITRLAFIALGLNDIRELYETDLDRLRGGGT